MILDPSTPHPVKQDEEEVAKFWSMMEKMVELPEDRGPNEGVNSVLVGYVKTASESYMTFINCDRDLCKMAVTLTESTTFRENLEFCLSKLLSLLNIDLLEMNMKFIIAYILLWESKNNLQSLEIMLEFQGFNVFYNTLYTQFAYLNKYGEDKNVNREINDPNVVELSEIELKIVDGMKQISTVLMDLIFQVLKFCKCSVRNVQIIDDFFVYYLMTSIRSDTVTDMFNNTQFKLLLALNEQYMILSKEYEIENKVFVYLTNDAVTTKFTELLLLKFNRVQDKSLQIMMCKILYLILTTDQGKIAKSFFYLNDLNVLVDVLIREIENIPENEETLRNYFLRIMEPLFQNTQLSETHYRKDDLVKVLVYLSSVDNFCTSDKILKEHRITAKLASRILERVEWLNCVAPEVEAFDSDTSTSRKSSFSGLGITPITTVPTMDNKRTDNLYNNRELGHSAESLGRRKSRPPPPLPPSRKLALTRTISRSTPSSPST
ncbi:hypothetical protein HG537_0B04980 [Torulaspora globosa]|uniref:SPIN90/Ldb17 leucine-rich domain-containing protein n=1 Tax=Torulaspora globosa TaxID=48254 RepID=A0A7H9HP96_9SACH|nr:hypothetical protein HG537_0B04980 [Torulaspora sp. CBS 2947]